MQVFIEDIVDLTTVEGALNLELGVRVTNAMITENHTRKVYHRTGIIAARAAEALGLCDICRTYKAGSRWDPKLCSGCGFTAHVEGYI
jgi:hypothetical protein